MKQFFRKNIEPNTKIRTVEIIAWLVFLVGTIVSCAVGLTQLYSEVGDIQFIQSIEMERDYDEEDYDEDYTVCDVTYVKGDKTMVVTYTYEEYIELDNDSIIAYEYETENGTLLYFEQANPDVSAIKEAYKETMAEATAPIFNASIAFVILVISISVMLFFGKIFTTYEKTWFLSIMTLATIVSIFFPEESANGVNGIVIMLLYLLDTFLNILCELLISKQSRFNFLVSVLVEICEIVICLVLMYRFATMATTLFFWLPIDILSYVNWTKHKDDDETELTKVRSLKGWQEVLILLGIVLWTFGVGYFISGLDIATDFYHDEVIETIIIYMDACASVVGVANGLFIFFRMREQWIAWYICAFLEAIINILSGQYVLLVLKLGYFTNTTYGYIKWSKYIKNHQEEKLTVF